MGHRKGAPIYVNSASYRSVLEVRNVNILSITSLFKGVCDFQDCDVIIMAADYHHSDRQTVHKAGVDRQGRVAGDVKGRGVIHVVDTFVDEV